jgi:DNA-binding GntR family transcriptional regulator
MYTFVVRWLQAGGSACNDGQQGIYRRVEVLMMATSILDKSTISFQVAKELRNRILAGRYASGEKLQQEQIAAELGVSRSPVREALGQLEAEGLVILTPQKGAQVSPISPAEISEFFELRTLVEPHLLALAIPRMTEVDFSRAAVVITEMTDVGYAGWSEKNWRFHETLYAPAERPAMIKILRRTHDTIGRYIRMQIVATDGRLTANEEHKHILDACRRRDVEAAVDLLKAHVIAAARLLHGGDNLD